MAPGPRTPGWVPPPPQAAEGGQRDQDVVSYQAFSGVRSDVTPERFGITDLTVANNCVLDKSGRIARRDGFTRALTTACHSLWASEELGLAMRVVGSELRRIAVDFSETVLRSGLTPGARMSYWRVNDRVYYANGVQTGVIENGGARSWGISIPPLPAVVQTIGNMPAGTYQYVATYFRNDGQESGAGLAGRVTVPDGAGLIFAMPTSTDPTVARKGIYLSTTNGEMLFLAGTALNSQATITYANDTTELNLPLATQFLGPPPAGHLIGYFRGRTYMGVENIWYPSEPFGYELFDLRKYIQMDGRITMFAPLEDKEIYEKGRKSGVFVGTDRTCGVFAGSDPEEFEYVAKTDYGAVLGAVDYVDGSLFGDNSVGAKQLPLWMSKAGLCVGLPDLEIRNITRTKYGFSSGGQGAALFIPGPNRYIVTSFF